MKLNVKKWLLASLAVFIVYFLLDYVIHAVIMMGDYNATKEVWRPMEDMKMAVGIIKLVIFSLLFVYIFTKGYEGKGVMEGIRYGLWTGLLIWILTAYTFYNVLPIPYAIAFKWWIFGTIQCMACGAVASLIYKPETAEAVPAEA